MLLKLLLQREIMNRGRFKHYIPSKQRESRNESQNRNELIHIPVRAQRLVVGKVHFPIAVDYLSVGDIRIVTRGSILARMTIK